MDRRRFLLTSLATALAALPAAEAQPSRRVPVVGILNTATPNAGSWGPVLRSGLHDLGYVEGQTIVLEFRHAENKPEVGGTRDTAQIR